MVPAVRAAISENDGLAIRYFAQLKWGLIPSWAKDPSIGYKMINARAETVAEKPAFRKAYRTRRCLVLADGYYEWKREGKVKQPYYFHLKSKQPFVFAGMWESWAKEKEVVESCTIITMPANTFMASYHHRMPYILPPENYDTWLDHSEESQALDLISHPAVMTDDALTGYPVSTLVNNPRNNSVECVKPL